MEKKVMIVEFTYDSDHKWYYHIQENKSIVTYNNNLNLQDFICQNKVRPILTFK